MAKQKNTLEVYVNLDVPENFTEDEKLIAKSILLNKACFGANSRILRIVDSLINTSHEEVFNKVVEGYGHLQNMFSENIARIDSMIVNREYKYSYVP